MKKTIILSGAGISAESGISTFRDSGGLWENHDVMEVCSVGGFARNRRLVLDFYDARRKDLKDKMPNPAHFMVASLQREFPGRVVNLTQNVDDLFERALCASVVHLHGELVKARCERCGESTVIGYDPIPAGMACPLCGAASMRHDIVMFGEAAPKYRLLQHALGEAQAEGWMLVVIGTSGQVLPVESYARMTAYSVLNNLELQADIDAGAFSRVLYGKAGENAGTIQNLVRFFLTENRP